MKKAQLFFSLVMIAGAGIAVLPQLGAAQAQQASPWKDRAEYDKYTAITQATDPAQQVKLIDEYLAAYPESKVKEQVLAVKLQAAQKQNDLPKIEETASKIVEINPKNLYALFVLSSLAPQTFNPQDPAAAQKLSGASDHAKAGLEALNALEKPANVSDEDFKKQKDQLEAAFHQTLGFVGLQKQEYEPAQQELHKSVELNPNDAAGYYRLGLAYLSPKEGKQYEQGIWALARAISITGPTALPADAQAQVKDYLNKVYEARHGSTDGLDKVMADAGTAPFPPQDFHIQTAEEAAPPEPEPMPQAAPQRELTVKAEELTDFGVIQKYLQAGGDKEADTWTILKGQSFPLPGKVISATPAAKPTKVQLAVAPELQTQEGKFDLEVTLSEPPAKPIAKGDIVTAEGTLDSYRAKPFLLRMVGAKVTK
jgi:hypothetical protein